MSRSLVLSTVLALSSAFQAPAPSAASTSLRAFDPSQELGAQAPAGYWDPIGIADNISPEQFDRYREVEQKHGRIAMIAVVGYCVPNYIGTFGDVKLSDVPNGVQALFKIPTLGLLQILLLIG